MFVSNESSLEFFLAAKNLTTQSAEYSSASMVGGWVGGMVAFVVALTGVIIAIRKNLELAHRILGQIFVLLNEIIRHVRREPNDDQPPALPPKNRRRRNQTDDERVEMGDRPTDRIYENLERHNTLLSQRPYDLGPEMLVWLREKFISFFHFLFPSHFTVCF